MPNIKNVLLLALCVILLTACGTKTQSSQPGITVVVRTPTPPAYPYPVQATVPVVNSVYPGPLEGSGSPEVVGTPEYYVTDLSIPKPSNGKAVVTGQLLVEGVQGKPYLGALYLASTIPPSTPDFPPLVSFSEQTDQLGVMDVNTGRFLFKDVAPGTYAIVLWTPFGGNPLLDSSGGTLLFDVKSDETKDLGIIPVK